MGRCSLPATASDFALADRESFRLLRQDVIADEDGRAWLIEANCPPNLFAYTNEPDHPDEKAITPLIRAMLTDLIVSRHRTPAQRHLACMLFLVQASP